MLIRSQCFDNVVIIQIRAAHTLSIRLAYSSMFKIFQVAKISNNSAKGLHSITGASDREVEWKKNQWMYSGIKI